MKRFQEQFQKRSERVRMSAPERRELKERLVSYMEYHPLTATTASTATEQFVRSEQFTLLYFNTKTISAFVGAFAMLVFIIVPVVAERAVPGDVLYPVKVNFNEEIRSTLSVSPYAKVEWETKRLERRIAEARLLASEGRLTEEVEAEVKEAVKEHSNAAQESIAAIRETDGDEAAIAEIAFESALTVQSEVLEGTLKKEVAAAGGASTTPGHSVAGLAGVVKEAQETATANKSGVTPSYEKLVARMELETTRAYELFDAIKEVASSEEIANIERRLTDVERKIVEAQKLRDGEESEESEYTTADTQVLPEVALLRIALSDLQKLISFMTDIDVRENVEIESLVPVTLTPEEQKVSIETQLDTAAALTEQLEAAFVVRATDGLTEKLRTGLTGAKELKEVVEIALQEEHYSEAHRALDDMLALLADVELLLGTQKEPEEIPLIDPEEVRGTSTEATASTTSETGVGEDGEATTTEEERATTTEEGT